MMLLNIQSSFPVCMMVGSIARFGYNSEMVMPAIFFLIHYNEKFMHDNRKKKIGERTEPCCTPRDMGKWE